MVHHSFIKGWKPLNALTLCVCPSVCPSVPALTFERFNFFQFCLRVSTYDLLTQVKFVNGRNRSRPPRVTGTPPQLFNCNPHIWYIKMEGFLTLRTMAVIILTHDPSVTYKSRSKVTNKGQAEFMTLLYVFWDGEHDKQHHFDLWPFRALEIEVTFVKI